MSINNKTPPKGAGPRTSAKVPGSTNATSASKPKAKAGNAAGADATGNAPWPDAFETDPQLNQSLAKSFADADGASGVRQSGMRQMSKVLQQTLKKVRRDIAELREEQSTLLAELVAGGFSEEAIGTGGDKRKARRDKLNALRRREISLKRRLKTADSEIPLRDPMGSDDVNALAAQIEDHAKKSSPNDQAMDILRSTGSPDAVLRIPVGAKERTSAHGDALAKVLPKATTAAWLTTLLSEGPRSFEGDTGEPLSRDASVLARYQKRARCLGQAA